MHEVLVNRLGGLSLPRESVVRLTDYPDMTIDVYRGHKTITQQQQKTKFNTKHTTVLYIVLNSVFLPMLLCSMYTGQCI